MRLARFPDGADAADVRSLVPPARSVEDAVREIVEEVRRDGDGGVARLTRRFDGVEVPPGRLRVSAGELDAARAGLEPDLEQGIATAIENVRDFAHAQIHPPVVTTLGAGQRIVVAQPPVRRAGAYVPGGRAPYASSVVMCAVTARAAGVREIAVCAPPGPDGEAHPVILAACALCEVDEVYRMGGAQAIAALAHGTTLVPAVDVIVGPGSAWVQEAKRQVFGLVGIDGIAGPSELVVVASSGADPELIALDLLAQGEHGTDSPLCAISDDEELLEEVERFAVGAASERPTVADAPLALVRTPDLRSALRLAEEIAPEHLELVGTEAEALAGEVTRAGAVFIGRDGATAFGDYVAGSNHVLPTGGAAAFASPLSIATFRRRMARVSFPPGVAAQLAPAGAALAHAEGFPVHAESMVRRGLSP